MSNQFILYIAGGAVGLLVIIFIAYYILQKKMNQSEYKQMQKLREGTSSNGFSLEILYQKLYITYSRVPGLKRYILKLRRRLEILDVDDEFATRRDSAKILTKSLAIVVPAAVATIIITQSNLLLMGTLLLFELVMIDTFIDGMVDKIDNKLLNEQIEFFSEIRHAYHEFNMVEEAIYQVSQDDEKNVSREGEKIYEVLISNDPENELEKYYDIAPNSFLKEFAGISYLTKEFGDRKVDGASLYLKNINNITQEMQLEILKRDKLNYVFQSLSIISVVPILLLEPLRNWAVDSFSFTQDFYFGKAGMIVQIILLIITFLSYILIRKLKDNDSTKGDTQNVENPWQSKVYKNPLGKKVTDLFIPKKGTKEYKKVSTLLKDSASKLKMEWLYVNRVVLAIGVFVGAIFVFGLLHQVAIDYQYEQPTSDYDMIGGLSEKDKKKAEELTKQDNVFLDRFKGNTKVTKEQIAAAMRTSSYFNGASDEDIDKAAERVLGKLKVINSEYLQWFELLLAFVFAIVGYMSPLWITMFQLKMRQMEMENEVMQFQTIILMLMRIERINVEIILEWLERYSNIFREPISKCVNNYEAGAWEALEELKNDITYKDFIRIIESMQAAVEKIPIRDAFDELDSERDYYQAKRKESNDRLIQRKGMIGKGIGFAPMICLFVGYLIVPLVFIGMMSMTQSMASLKS